MIFKKLLILAAVVLFSAAVYAKTHTETMAGYLVSIELAKDYSVVLDKDTPELKGLKISSPEMNDALFLVLHDISQGTISLSALRKIVEDQGEMFISQIEENGLNLQEIKNKEVCGYYFVITDKAPNPGECKYMLAGAFYKEKVLIQFRFVYNGVKADYKQRLDQLTAMSVVKKTK